MWVFRYRDGSLVQCPCSAYCGP
ncbi:hypothetical protein CURTO8I2_320018 [Curtobacterium sp. 8I-2]|nr:hypothetical protein CURTO8I2_320018 [Curtobacterium sp. 8I-2]